EIAPLAELFVRRACDQLERTRVPSISGDAAAMLERHTWPGNVRELRNAMERAVLVCGTLERILPEHLPPEIARAPGPARSAMDAHLGDRAARKGDAPSEPLPKAVAKEKVSALDALETERRELERRRIIEALEQCGYNQTKAAQMLGIARRTMTHKMNEHRI